jgi:L-lactate dehydrogenase complex protein LldF
MYVILLDNGRTDVLADPKQRESLYCIRCGACLNVCPVYKHIGGHTYQAAYSGPIGAVLMPNLQHFNEYIHLSNASSLCGACSAACPVGINLHNLLLDNRKVEREADLKDKSEVWMWKVWKQVMLRRSWMNAPKWLKNWALRHFFESAWGERRSLPQVDQASFNKLWKNGKV